MKSIDADKLYNLMKSNYDLEGLEGVDLHFTRTGVSHCDGPPAVGVFEPRPNVTNTQVKEYKKNARAEDWPKRQDYLAAVAHAIVTPKAIELYLVERTPMIKSMIPEYLAFSDYKTEGELVEAIMQKVFAHCNVKIL